MVAEAQTLRPLSIGQLLDRAIRLYRRNFVTFTGIIALVLVPLTLLELVGALVTLPDTLAMQTPDPYADPSEIFMQAFSASTGGGVVCITTLLRVILLIGVAGATMSRAAANSYLGEDLDIFEAYGRASRSLGRVLLGMLLVAVVGVIVVILGIVIPCIGWIFIMGFVFYFAIVINQLYIPITALEDRDPINAIRRAWDLVRRRFWWVLGFMLVLSIFAGLVLTGPAALIRWISQAVLVTMLPNNDPKTLLAIQTVLQQLTTMFTNLIYLPLHLTAVIVMYFDLRVRTEGFDLSVMAAQSDEGAPANNVEQLIANAPPAGGDSLLTGNEVLSFGGVALALYALYAVLYFVLFAIVMAIMGASGGFGM